MIASFRRPLSEKIASVVQTSRTTSGAGAAVPGGKPAARFVTISQLAGAGGEEVAEELIRRLNTVAPWDQRWEAFDRDAIEAAAADAAISRDLIESLEDSSRTWLTDFRGMSLRDHNPSDLRAMRKVAQTIRALAQAGRVVLLGWGSGYITSGMPGGVHVWLVARAQDRAARLGRALKLDSSAAMREIQSRDDRRTAFYKRYWPLRLLGPERFTLTLNASLMTVGQMAGTLESMLIEGHPPITSGGVGFFGMQSEPAAAHRHAGGHAQ